MRVLVCLIFCHQWTNIPLQVKFLCLASGVIIVVKIISEIVL